MGKFWHNLNNFSIEHIPITKRIFCCRHLTSTAKEMTEIYWILHWMMKLLMTRCYKSYSAWHFNVLHLHGQIVRIWKKLLNSSGTFGRTTGEKATGRYRRFLDWSTPQAKKKRTEIKTWCSSQAGFKDC